MRIKKRGKQAIYGVSANAKTNGKEISTTKSGINKRQLLLHYARIKYTTFFVENIILMEMMRRKQRGVNGKGENSER